MILTSRPIAAFLLAVLGCAAAAVAVPTAAAAVTDCASGQSSAWTNTSGGAWSDTINWSNGVPTAGCDVSIVAAGTYTVVVTDEESANSLTLGAPSGTQTLELQGSQTSQGDPRQAIFGVHSDQTLTVGTHGVIDLTSAGPNPGAAILNGGQLVNSGVVRTDPGSSGASTFKDIRTNVTNNPGGVITFNADTTSCDCGVGGTWINNGTINTAAGTSSRLSRSGAGEQFSQPASTGTINNLGHLVVDGTLTNAAGTTTGNPVEVCGNLGPSGPSAAKFAFAQLAVCNGYALTSDIGPATSVLVRNQTTSGSITVGLSQDITNKGTLTFDAVAGAPQVQLASGKTLTNDGTLNFDQPGSSLLQAPLLNHGSVNLGPANALTVNSVMTQTAGTFTVAPGATLSTNQHVTLSGGTIANHGTFTEVNDTFSHSGGSTSGSPIQICGSTIDPTGPGTASFLLEHTSSCGYPTIGGDIGPGDTVDVQATTMTADTFFGSIVNHGTLRLDGNQTNQLHGNLLTNYGTFAVNAGVGNMAMQLVNHGAVTVSAAATMNFSPAVSLDGGTFAVAGTFNGPSITQSGGVTTIDGAANPTSYSLVGGTLQGAGTVTASNGVSNTGGTVHPGHSPGILTIAGNYSQSAGGTLSLTVAGTTPGTGYSRLAVSGAAALAGSLHISNPTAVTKPLRAVTAGSLTGKFATTTATGQRFVVGYDANGVTLTAVPVTKPPVKQALTRVRLTPATVTTGKSTTLRYSLAKAATATVTITRRLAGRTRNGHCNLRARKGTRCYVLRTYLHSRLAGKAGTNSARLGVQHFAAGRYTVTITVPAASGATLKKTLVLTIKKTSK